MLTRLGFYLLRRAIQRHSDFAWGWHCNIAMSAHDEGMESLAANRAAARFMKLCFDVDTSDGPPQSERQIMHVFEPSKVERTNQC